MLESKQEVTKVVSLVKPGRKSYSVNPVPLKDTFSQDVFCFDIPWARSVANHLSRCF